MLSILITHYNRSEALQQCVTAAHNVSWPMPYEVVVSDDGSNRQHVNAIKQIPKIKLVLAESNQGLAANINKGIQACTGTYLLYCQEDFLIKKEIECILPELFSLLDNKSLDMIRLRANYQFPKLNALEKHVYSIPKFSFKNFYYNAFQYSDNLFMTTPDFFIKNKLYLEHTSGDYGETEYAIRIFKSDSKIGITQPYYSQDVEGSISTMRETRQNKQLPEFAKKIKKFARAVRLHFEWLMYNPEKRKLLTYKNRR
ncbi:MAG: glycosyltransferase family 2 protein [Winogradskyella arenosi]